MQPTRVAKVETRHLPLGQVSEFNEEIPRAMAAEEGLALYQFMSCPFCAHVRSAAGELGLEIELRDIHATPEYAEELRAAMGRSTVPVLRIAEGDGEPRWLPESTEIVSYLQQRFA